MKKLSIIKIGGNVIDNELELKKFLTAFSNIDGLKILVHGGGKIATELGQKLSIEANIIDGRRVTDAETLKLVTMVYAGLINKNIVALLQSFNTNAIGLCGADASIIPATLRNAGSIDYGFAGDPLTEKINTAFLNSLIASGYTPIISPITHNGKGQLLNTNADTIAAALACALSKNFKVDLIYCFEKKGVLKDVNTEAVIREITPSVYEALKENGTISGGMLPKIKNAFDAIHQGVNKVIIGSSNELALLIHDNRTSGTTITA